MRRRFGELMHQQMQSNERIWIVTADLGKGLFDKIWQDFPDRFVNVGAAESSGVDICCALALEGKIPFFYTITPFITRAWESLRVYVNYEKLNVKIVGSGRDTDYAHDGWSHHAQDIPEMMKCFKNIVQMYPADERMLESMLPQMINSNIPCFLSLKR